jgi:hypothetical protein
MIISKTGILRFIKIFSENESSLNKETLLESTINYIRSSNDTQIIYDFPYNNSNKKLVYRIFGGIYIVMIVDDLENELAILDFINVIMKALDEVFGGICELHIILNPEKIYLLIDEAICGGMVIETNKNEIIKNYNSKFKEDEGYKIIPGLF